MKTPDMKPAQMNLDTGYVNSLLGVSFTKEEIKTLLEKMRHGVKEEKTKNQLKVLIPAYRTDILHPMDLVEDIAIAYGYENFEPALPKIATIGKKDPMEKFTSLASETMLGFGFQEVMTLIMTSRDLVYGRMMIPEEDVVEAEKPVSTEHSICRTWLLPTLLSVLEKNRNREYPQNIFEAGDCVLGDGTQKRKLAGLIAHSRANYSETRAIVTGLLESLDVKYEITPLEHKSFIEGRCGRTSTGFFGELHPQVLENFGLEIPVSAFELDLGLIRRETTRKD